MTGDQNPAPGPAPGVPIKVTPEILLQVLTTPPASGPAPFPAVPVDLPAPADIANGALFAAGNSGVPGDVESSGLEDLDRRAHAADAVQKFSANEADAAQQFQGVGAQAEAQGATQMMQQAVSGITGALGGAVVRDIAKVVNLRSAPGFSFVSEDLDRVRSLMRSVLCSLAVFHNPRDVKLMVVTRNPEVWAWMVWLPHNLHDELFDACGWRRLIFATPEELEAALGSRAAYEGQARRMDPADGGQPNRDGLGAGNRAGRRGFGAAPGDRRRQHRQPGCVGERGRAGRQGRAYGAAHRVPGGHRCGVRRGPGLRDGPTTWGGNRGQGRSRWRRRR